MKKNILRTLFAFFVSVLCLESCKKEAAPFLEQEPEVSSVKNKASTSGIPSPDLDWEGMSPFPLGPTNSVWAPWAGVVPRQFPSDYLDDYRSSDGWDLYLNTFTTSSVPNNPYFILYNRYRGTIRIYYYMASSSSTETPKVTFQLDLNGTVNNSKILSFEQGEIIPTTTPLSVSKVQPYLVVQGGAWYSEEFELAYDPNLSQQEFTNNQLRLTMYATNVTNYSISGTQTGTIDGTIESPAAPFNLFGSLFKGAVSVGVGQLGLLASGSKIAGKIFSTNLGPIKLEKMKEGIDEAANGSIKDGGKSIFNAVLSALTGGGGSGGSQQKVNLKINSNISLTGTGVSSPSGVFTQSFFISNTKGLVDRAVGFIPLYQKSLGVFSLSGTPTVDLFYRKNRKQPVRIHCDYEVNESSFNVLFNSDLINSTDPKGARIENLKKEVVLLNLGGVEQNSYITDLYAQDEYIAYNDAIIRVLTGESISIYVEGPHAFSAPSDPAVRISFDVVPNNGGPRTTIVKTFKANLQRTDTTLP